MRQIVVVGLQMLLIVGIAMNVCRAAVFPQDRGAWPEDWPKELEPLRETSRTIGIGTGIQENIYEIPISDRETFEKVWPAVLKLRTPGSPLTLHRADSTPPKNWGDFLSNANPAIRIYAPTGSYSMKEAVDLQNPPDFEALVREGRALRARAPWPKAIVGKNGELPEYVVSEKGPDGRLIWVAADPFQESKGPPRGFYNRARIDIELVVDGKVIDLNHVEFPDGVVIIDHRFPEP